MYKKVVTALTLSMLFMVPVYSAPVFAASIETSSSAIVQDSESDSAKDTASIYIGLKDIGTPKKDINFEIYKIADYNPNNGSFHYDEEWGLSSLPENSEELDSLANELSKDIEYSPVRTCVTDENGNASIDTIDCGIYLIVADNTDKYGEISPFILRLPYLDSTEGEKDVWVYKAEVEPKVTIPGILTPTPTVSPLPDAVLKDTSNVNTGDYTNITILILCIMFAAVNIKIFVKKK